MVLAPYLSLNRDIDADKTGFIFVFLLISSIQLAILQPYLGSRFETSSRDGYATGFFCEFEEIMT